MINKIIRQDSSQYQFTSLRLISSEEIFSLVSQVQPMMSPTAANLSGFACLRRVEDISLLANVTQETGHILLDQILPSSLG
jgi:hypothetical protein